MKKIIIVLLALFLALPAISYAGSVTSRWDMTIGGFVKVDMGYNDQLLGADAGNAARSGMNGSQVLANEYGNFFTAAGETRLNFLIKGPDGGGAKTSAFIEGDFRGATNTAEGNFALRHAFLKLDWPNATLTAGQTWQRWGFIPSYAAVGQTWGFADLGPFLKGQRQPRLDYEQRFGKNLSASIALVSPNNIWGTAGNTTVNNFSSSPYPFLEGEFKFNTEKCGVIGPYGMMMALGGFYGQEKIINQYGLPNAGANSVFYTDRNVNSWGIALKGFIPIIPEKNKNKAGALALGGNLFYGQNISWYGGLQSTYERINTGTTSGAATGGSYSAFNAQYVAPTLFGGFVQGTYFFTDKLFVDTFFGYTASNTSNTQRTMSYYTVTGAPPGYVVTPNNVNSVSHFIVNLNYDLNQAVRFGIQYSYIRTVYDNYVNLNPVAGIANPSQANTANIARLADRTGSVNSIRIGAMYFF